MRLTLYKRIASAADEASLRDLQVEMIDRFGLLPAQTKHLFQIAEIRQKARAIGISHRFSPRLITAPATATGMTTRNRPSTVKNSWRAQPRKNGIAAHVCIMSTFAEAL